VACEWWRKLKEKKRKYTRKYIFVTDKENPRKIFKLNIFLAKISLFLL